MRIRLLSIGMFVTVFFTSASSAAAQLGLMGGGNLSRFVGADAADESKTGLNFGGAFTLLRMGGVSVGPEVYYAQKGGAQVRDDGTFTVGVDYLEVPLLARLGLPVPGASFLRPYVSGGPAYAWRLACDVEEDASPSTDPCLAADFSNRQAAIRTADTGLVLGAGLGMNVGSFGGVTLDARLVRGLRRLTEGVQGPDVKNQAISFMLGYSIRP